MAWTGNPSIPTLLTKALAIDETVREEIAKANPGVIDPTQAVVTDGNSFNNVEETASATLSVSDYGVTHVTINPEPTPTATKTLVTNGVLVAAQVNSDDIGGFTPTVSNGALTGITLSENAGVVVDGQTFAVEGGTVTINVTANVISASFTAGG